MDMTEKFVKNREYRKALGLPDEQTESYELLAQGEYNVNYLFTHPVTGRRLVLRINMGSQMHLDRQIEYEAHALRLLSGCGRTPEVIYTDGSCRYIPHGVMVMDYLPGRCPVYENEKDMKALMECMADIHSVSIPGEEVVYGEPFGESCVPRDTVKLIAPQDAAEAILNECESMLEVYMQSPLGNDQTKDRLRRLLDRAHDIASAGGQDSGGETVRCCINTELNSTNFLVDDKGFARLVDWEKPLYGDPAQDLGHMLAPTTTFWKTDTVLSRAATDKLMDIYIEAAGGRIDTGGLKERTDRLLSVTCLRGLTWCAMAWVQYKDPDKEIVNESTRKKLDAYLSDPFLAGIEERLF
ncbi:MAG: aminoglycoside phosphotransferase family protein [Mogibacterium sp.]|nr:aminoglycoside phosphotransferase family protein [Mogibacterium sp.]